MERETAKRNRNMKVVCANLGENLCYKTNREDITVGKSYDVHYQQPGQYVIFDDHDKIELVNLIGIKNDRCEILTYNQKLFVSLEEWRDIQLQKLEI